MSTPDPATTEWVPLWGLSGAGSGSTSLTYKGAWSAGSYAEGDIVVDGGVVYMAQVQTSKRPSGNWPLQSTPITLPRVTSAQMTALTPYDGMEVGLIVDDTNGIVWHLRYNANSASVYKWEFVGGPPLTSIINTDDSTTTSGSWLNLPSTNGPSITIPRAGDYTASYGSEYYNSATNNAAVGQGVCVGDTSPPMAAGRWIYNTTPVAGTGYSSMMKSPITGLNASDVLKVRYYSGSAGAAHWRSRWLDVIPARVS